MFDSKGDTDIEHLVARSEAHDSGLCRADAATRRAFSRDLLNLTLASPRVNRQKGAKDAAEWQPDTNQCWFAQTVVDVRRAYRLTIDRREAAALDRILVGCSGLNRSKLKLSKWAEDYERGQGKIRCPQRERMNPQQETALTR